jgi:hypothetical protein
MITFTGYIKVLTYAYALIMKKIYHIYQNFGPCAIDDKGLTGKIRVLAYALVMRKAYRMQLNFYKTDPH